MKKLFLALSLLSFSAFAINQGASLNRAPSTVYVNQKMGASLAVWNYTYCSGCSLTVLDIIPQTWVTVGGSSAVPVGWDKPALGPGAPTVIAPGSSVIYRYQAKFFAPSVSPAWDSYTNQGNSLVSQGTQTYSIGALVRTNNGEVTSSTNQTVTVLPLPLPASQQGDY